LKETDAVLALETPLPMSNMIDAVNRGIVVADVAAPGYREVALKRRVARFDIVNHKDYTNIEVTGVVVKKGKLSGEILDKALTSYTLESSDSDGEKVFDFPANGNGQILNLVSDYNIPNDVESGLSARGLVKSLNTARFYLYPTKVAADGSATEIFLTGKFKGIPHVYPLTLTGTEVDIEANYVYQIVVNRATNDLYTFTLLKVAPWEDYTGDVIESGVSDEFETFSNLLDKTDADKGVDHDFSNAEAGDADLELHVEYKSMSATPPVMTLESVDRGDGVTVPKSFVEDAIKFVAEDPVLTRAFGQSVYYTHVITITLAQPAVPAKAELTISHPELGQLQKYTFSSIGRYPGTTEKPVLVGGIYWAPVNVGATELVHSFGAATTDVMNTARVGYYFSWGRDYARFENTTTIPVYLLGPVTATDAAGIYANTIIYNPTSPNDWLTPRNDDLWSDINPQGPCPAGWQVPTIDDFLNTFTNTSDPLAPNYVSNELTTKHMVIVSGDDSETLLYIPGAGNIRPLTGIPEWHGDAMIFWTRSSNGSGKSFRYDIEYGSTNGRSLAMTRMTPYNVRCIEAI
jgi:uncharacterized protein (TIGR02145 family)